MLSSLAHPAFNDFSTLEAQLPRRRRAPSGPAAKAILKAIMNVTAVRFGWCERARRPARGAIPPESPPALRDALWQRGCCRIRSSRELDAAAAVVHGALHGDWHAMKGLNDSAKALVHELWD